MQTMQELDVNYMSGADNPWIPFTPLSDQVFLKYWKVYPVRGEIVVSMKFPAGLELAPHYHTASWSGIPSPGMALPGKQLGLPRGRHRLRGLRLPAHAGEHGGHRGVLLHRRRTAFHR